jgi:hypothetical protein
MLPAMLNDAPIIRYIRVSDMARARRFYEDKVASSPAPGPRVVA